VLLAAWLEGELVGTVQLVLDMPPNQPHRADVAKLLVDPKARRAGVGRALMRRLEQTARGIGRRLLVLDTLQGDAAEALYRGMGWNEAGVVPGFALLPDGSHGATVFFWKRMGP
jgi:GNAT superfamily N-acetyltransferase